MEYIFTLFGPYSFSIIEAHMAFVHLPIGFLLGSAIFDIAACFTKREDHHAHWRHTAFWLLLLGTLCAALAATLGYFGNPFATKHNIMARHGSHVFWFWRGGGISSLKLLAHHQKWPAFQERTLCVCIATLICCGVDHGHRFFRLPYCYVTGSI